MGMDAYLYLVHNRKECETEDFYNKCITVEDRDAWDEYDFDKPAEVWYARKFWSLHETVFGNNYECGDYLVIDKGTLKMMLDFAIHNKDFFGGFNTVESLCWVLYHYDEFSEHGMVLVYEADW